MQRRVVITGIGVMSSIGQSVDEFWNAILETRSGIRPLDLGDTPVPDLRFTHAAQVQDYNPKDRFQKRDLDLMDRFTQFTTLTAREAIADAGIEWTDELRTRTAIVTGSSLGGQQRQDEAYHSLQVLGKKRTHPLTIPTCMANAPASHLSMEFGIQGPTLTVATACASATHSIGIAAGFVRSGLVDFALAGGAECPITDLFLRMWDAMRVTSPTTCRPFSKGRDGMILGEGAGTMVLESLESAMARGAEPYAEIVGFGMSADADHITRPSSKGAELAMAAALKDGQLNPDEVGYINAHGTGTTANDAAESRAIGNIFGAPSEQPLVSSTKSMHGHTLAAAGALETAATVMALKHGVLPPTTNFLEADPECGVNLLTESPRPQSVDVAMSNSFGFGGLNAVLAFRRWQA